jgi:hypothetical protein
MTKKGVEYDYTVYKAKPTPEEVLQRARHLVYKQFQIAKKSLQGNKVRLFCPMCGLDLFCLEVYHEIRGKMYAGECLNPVCMFAMKSREEDIRYAARDVAGAERDSDEKPD